MQTLKNLIWIVSVKKPMLKFLFIQETSIISLEYMQNSKLGYFDDLFGVF